MIIFPSCGGVAIASTRAGPPGVSTVRTIARHLLADCLRLTRKVRLNRSQRHRPKGRSGWFIGVHWWPVSGRVACSCGGSESTRVLAGALTGRKRSLPNQIELVRPVEGLGAVPCAELAVDVAGVAIDGVVEEIAFHCFLFLVRCDDAQILLFAL